MTETDKTSKSRPTDDEEYRMERLRLLRSRSRIPMALLVLTPVLIVALYFSSWFMRAHMMSGASVAPSSTAVIVELEQRLTNVEQQVQALDDKVGGLERNLPVSVSTELPGAQPAPAAPIASAASLVATAHMQNDLVALSAAVDAMQAEVKLTGNAAAQTQQATQNALAATVAFIQLRETAATGGGFETDLAALRAVAGGDNGFQEPLAQLARYAPTGAPTIDALREEFEGLESPASVALDKATAQNWRQRLWAGLKGLVSVRPLHGGTGPDAFAPTETALVSGDLAAALEAVKGLPPEAQAVFKDWQARAEARKEIDSALRVLADRLIAQNAAPSTTPALSMPAPPKARDEP